MTKKDNNSVKNKTLILENNSIIHGCSLAILKKIPSKSIKCVITSPPYWGLRNYRVRGQIGLEKTLNHYLQNIDKIFIEVFRILEDDGTLWLNIGDGYTSGNRKYRAVDKKNGARYLSGRPKTPKGLKPKDLHGIPWRIAFMLQDNGWYLRTDIIWNKPNCMPESVKDRPYRSHEYFFLFSKSKRYYFNDEGLYVDGKRLRSVWEINSNSWKGIHNATFPEELILPAIKSATNVGDLILDPFFGSGTVGVVSEKLNRKFIGIEINEKFIKESIPRFVNKPKIISEKK